ncbi:MAG: MFS transporter [Gammaproteobacteria bacterium]|nr:MFS transporter [Gammaproteobacteria bacterium]
MSQTNPPALESRYAWMIVVVSSVLMGMGAGALVSISVFLKPLIAEFGWLRAETAFAYTAGAIAMGIGGIVMGYLSDRFSTRWVALAGMVFLGFSLLLIGNQRSLWQFYLLYCVMGGFGAAALDAPLLANVGTWFERNKGLALGVATAGRSLGQGLVPFVGGILVATYGWRHAYVVLGTVSFALVPLAWLVRSPPGLKEAKIAARATSPSEQSEAFPVKPIVAVAWLSVAAIFCCIAMGTPMVHVVALARDAGIDQKSAAGVILLVYLSGFFGRIFFGKMADHIGGIHAYLTASAIQTAFVFWFTQLDSLTGFYILAVLFGFGMSGVMTCLIVSVRELTPVYMRGISTGTIFLTAWIGMGLGGYQGGLFFDQSGAYIIPYANAAFAGIVNLAIVGSLLFYFTRKQAQLMRVKAA